MSPARIAAVTILTALLSGSAVARPQSWLGVEPEPPPAPPAEAPDFHGLRPVPARVISYHHPFSAEAHRRLASRSTRALEADRTYLLRSAPGPAERVASYHFVRHLARSLPQYGLRPLADPPGGGIPHTPLLAAVRRLPAEDAKPLPDWMEAAEVEGAVVRLALLGLPAAPEASPLEIPLLESETLPAPEALGRAGVLYARAGRELVPEGDLTREALAERWPAATRLLAEVEDDGLVLAVRVLWKAGPVEIPGPGGVMIRAVDKAAANPRLYRLYEPRSP